MNVSVQIHQRLKEIPTDVILKLSYELRTKGALDEARRLLTRLLPSADFERKVDLMGELSLTEARAGNIDEAIRLRREVLELAPWFDPHAYQLACLFAYHKRFAEADVIFRRDLRVLLGNGEATTTAIVRF